MNCVCPEPSKPMQALYTQKHCCTPLAHSLRFDAPLLLAQVSDATFDAEVLKSDVPVMVDFWAPWCGPCKMIAPMVDEIARDYAGACRRPPVLGEGEHWRLVSCCLVPDTQYSVTQHIASPAVKCTPLACSADTRCCRPSPL